MAVTNIGGFANAIAAGKKAANHINYGPIPDPMNAMIDNGTGEWAFSESKSDLFIWGSHKWGGAEKKVDK